MAPTNNPNFSQDDPPTVIPGVSELFLDDSPQDMHVLPAQLVESEYRRAHEQKVVTDHVALPLLGRRPAAQHMRILLVLFVIFFAAAVLVGGYAINRGNVLRNQLSAMGTVQLSAAQLSKSVTTALVGDAPAFQEMEDSYKLMSSNLNGLQSGGNGVEKLSAGYYQNDLKTVLDKLGPTMPTDVKVIADQKKTLVNLAASISSIHTDVTAIQDYADELKGALTQRSAPAAQTIAVGEMSMLAERIEKSAKEFLTPAGISPEGVFSLGKDVTTFETYSKAFTQGDTELGIVALQGEERASMEKMQGAFASLQGKTNLLLQDMQNIVAARQAQSRVLERLKASNEDILELNKDLGIAGVPWWLYVAMAVSGILAILCAVGLAYVQLSDSRRLQKRAEAENHSNQTAILRLMNELQNVAEGDLTQEATVTEDITGSIADSVNATVEELRALVGNVQTTADNVAQTTADVELTSNTLLDASTEQLNEIRNTGQAVVDMAGRINMVSTQAQESAAVAQRSRQAAEQGFKAVQNSIEGMNVIRDQIQDTAKRIKRLGESSQEIGEITELISDITEQTNVLALNAAIQAASAGEAGRGFSVVAEEVQRLAERSGEATRQIAALVKTIQTDTHDAVAAMERSTQGVVQGAHLSDNAGQALGEIDKVSRQLADLIQKISATTSEEAQSANAVASNIQQIFAVTEQATEGTRTTATQVRALARVAQELRSSVARFKIG